ncbi:sigma-70 family RNA polymerase sigma factor [Marinobacter sp. BGYM27]|uniref:sigma-70 family RNA polymerase sigma factor n=1 Tax=unclassified Marinobacter TaxID=83889 RepID=UPI0021A5DF12|nr:sigma-70 family RNA polymerase sigma factor [Marinobacter sp. BGYM27]MDG5499377.1 sigma-70 family RNA polymerase sigma factor [Marinobacter sp. BGYM27]
MGGKSVAMETDTFDYEACIRACASRNKKALRDLYLEEGNRLMGVVFNIVKNRSTAEDLIHDLFLKIWQKAHTFDPSRGNGRSWIYSIARHLALDSIRFSKRQVTQDFPIDDIPDTRDSGWYERVNSTHWGMGNHRIQDCIMALEPERRSCIYHAYVNGYSQSEISDLLGAPLGSVKSWIKRSLLALRECLG